MPRTKKDEEQKVTTTPDEVVENDAVADADVDVEEQESVKKQAEAVNYNYEDIIKESLLKTGRDGIVDLISYLREIGFFTAPASGGNHSNEEGGLARHSVNVMWTIERLGVSLLGDENYNIVQDSAVIVALLHDLGKCGDFGKQMYVPNMIKDGRPTKAAPEQKYKQSEAKPWKRNPDLLPLDHATRSIKLATLFIDLTEEEEFAIRYHDGLYETANYGIKGHETQLYMLLHWADMWSSRVIDGDTGESEGE
jgi:23S rRNA maturation-related 3'-5' exoribonuclease YhaM